jgi:ribonucleoside-diphosphate reductase alpha chain
VLIPESLKNLKEPTSSPNYNSLRSIKNNRPNNRVRESILVKYGYKDDFYAAKISSITNGFAEVYDIEVENTHSYLVDGIVTHNTVNVPNDYPYEAFKNIYIDAWKAGVKGITTYRAGTMTAVVEKVQDQNTKDAKGRPTKIVKSEAPKRPKDLVCEIHQARICGKKWVILVGLLDNRPYEVFAGPAESISLKGVGVGVLRRKGAGKYSLITENNPEIENIVEVFGDIESAWATRMVSMPLRHGVPIEYICETLSKDGVVTDVNKVLARTLRKYVTEVETEKKVRRCLACGSSNVNTIGCILCLDCGYEKCS